MRKLKWKKEAGMVKNGNYSLTYHQKDVNCNGSAMYEYNLYQDMEYLGSYSMQNNCSGAKIQATEFLTKYIANIQE